MIKFIDPKWQIQSFFVRNGNTTNELLDCTRGSPDWANGLQDSQIILNKFLIAFWSLPLWDKLFRWGLGRTQNIPCACIAPNIRHRITGFTGCFIFILINTKNWAVLTWNLYLLQEGLRLRFTGQVVETHCIDLVAVHSLHPRHEVVESTEVEEGVSCSASNNDLLCGVDVNIMGTKYHPQLSQCLPVSKPMYWDHPGPELWFP